MRPISKNLGRILFILKVQCFKNNIYITSYIKL